MSYRPECACEFLALGFSLFLFRLLLVLSLVAVVIVGVVVVVWLLSPLNHERQTRKDTATITGHCHHHQHHHRRNTGGANKYTSNLW